jgi:hypothetical protein
VHAFLCSSRSHIKQPQCMKAIISWWCEFKICGSKYIEKNVVNQNKKRRRWIWWWWWRMRLIIIIIIIIICLHLRRTSHWPPSYHHTDLPSAQCITEGASSPVCHVTHSHWTDLQPYNYKFDCSQWHLRVRDWRINTYENSMFHFDKELLILKQECFREISAFLRRIVEVFALLGCYAALVGISLLAFRDIISVPSSRIKQSKNLDCLTPWSLKMGPMGCTN